MPKPHVLFPLFISEFRRDQHLFPLNRTWTANDRNQPAFVDIKTVGIFGHIPGRPQMHLDSAVVGFDIHLHKLGSILSLTEALLVVVRAGLEHTDCGLMTDGAKMGRTVSELAEESDPVELRLSRNY